MDNNTQDPIYISLPKNSWLLSLSAISILHTLSVIISFIFISALSLFFSGGDMGSGIVLSWVFGCVGIILFVLSSGIVGRLGRVWGLRVWNVLLGVFVASILGGMVFYIFTHNGDRIAIREISTVLFTFVLTFLIDLPGVLIGFFLPTIKWKWDITKQWIFNLKFISVLLILSIVGTFAFVNIQGTSHEYGTWHDCLAREKNPNPQNYADSIPAACVGLVAQIHQDISYCKPILEDAEVIRTTRGFGNVLFMYCISGINKYNQYKFLDSSSYTGYYYKLPSEDCKQISQSSLFPNGCRIDSKSGITAL